MRPSAALASIVLIVTSCSGSDNRTAVDDGLTSEQTPAPTAEEPPSPTFERSEEREEMVRSQLENDRAVAFVPFTGAGVPS